MSDVDERRGDDADEAHHAGRLDRARVRLNAATKSVGVARERHATVALPFRIVERESRVAASVLAGGLAYKLFLWLLPLGLILGGVFGVNNTNDLQDAIRGGGLVGAVINTIGDSTRATGFDPWLLLVIGVGGIIWAGRSGARAVQLVYALIWDEPPPRARGLLASLAFTGFLCALLIVVGLSWWIRDNLSLVAPLPAIAIIPPIAGLWVLISLLLPHGNAPWRELLPGALLVALGFVLIHELIGAFLFPKLQEATGMYGVLGAMTTILFYMYWVAALAVEAATLNHSLHEELRSRRQVSSDDKGSGAREGE